MSDAETLTMSRATWNRLIESFAGLPRVRESVAEHRERRAEVGRRLSSAHAPEALNHKNICLSQDDFHQARTWFAVASDAAVRCPQVNLLVDAFWSVGVQTRKNNSDCDFIRRSACPKTT
jgi:hypothetical protein